MSAQTSDCTRIGHLIAPHGVSGGIKLFVLGDPGQLTKLSKVYVEKRGWLKLQRTEVLNLGVALHLAGIGSRDAAEELRGLNVYALDTELPPLEEGSYYYHNLRGLRLLDSENNLLGHIKDIEDLGYQDLLVIQPLGDAAIAYAPLQAPYVLVVKEAGAISHIQLSADAPEGLIGSAED